MNEVLDILKEIGRIAAYHGSSALSNFLGNKILLSPSSADFISIEEVPPNIHIDKVGVAIFYKINVGIRGDVVFILDERNAFKLIDLSKIKKEEERELSMLTEMRELSVLTEMGVSIIKEIGHMVIGSYLTALSLTLERMIVPPLPTFLSGTLKHIFLDFIFSPSVVEEAEKHRYFIQTLFESPQEQIKGYLCLILPPKSVEEIKETFKGTLEKLE